MRSKRVLAVLLILAFSLSLIGCSKLPLWPDRLSNAGENAPAAVPAAAPAEINISEGEPAGPTVLVDLYFTDASKRQLFSEKRQVPKVVGIARATMEEFLKGPGPEANLLPCVPPGTSLLDINVRSDGLCVVDLSKEMRSKSLDPMAETLAVYSVVNTLTQFSTVKRVQILVNGQKVESLNGKVLISEPLVRDASLIGKV